MTRKQKIELKKKAENLFKSMGRKLPSEETAEIMKRELMDMRVPEKDHVNVIEKLIAND